MKLNNRVSSVLIEFAGALLLSLVLLNLIYNRLNAALFQAAVTGLVLLVMLVLFPRENSGYFNPAVTIAKWTARKLQTVETVFFLLAHGLAGVVAWTLGGYLLNTEIVNIANKQTDWRIFATEAIAVGIFAFAIARIESDLLLRSKLALLASGTLAVSILIAGLAGNAVANPAVALGVQSVSFAYIAGPILGAIIGYNLYSLDSVTLPQKQKTTTAKRKKRIAKATAKPLARTKRKPVKRPIKNTVRSR